MLQVPLLLAAAAMAAVFAWQTFAVRFAFSGNWTALFCTGDGFTVPPELSSGTYRWRNSFGYDGQFYRYIAHDPFFRKGYSRYIDDARLRYRRILMPALAHSLALGRRGAIDGAILGTVLLSIGAGVYWSAGYFRHHGRRPAWGLVFVAAPATLASFDRLLIDSGLTALFAGFVLYVERGEWRKAWVICLLGPLARETGLFLPAGAVVYWLYRRQWAKAAAFCAAVLPAALWAAFVWVRTGPSLAHGIITWPGLGIVRRLFLVRPYPDPFVQAVLNVAGLASIVGLIASLVFAAWWLRRSEFDAVAVAVALFFVLALILGSPNHMAEAYGYARPISPLLLWVMWRAVLGRVWVALAAPLAVSASVALYVIGPVVSVLRGRPPGG